MRDIPWRRLSALSNGEAEGLCDDRKALAGMEN